MFPFAGPAGPGFQIGDLAIWPVPVLPAHLSMFAARKVTTLRRVSLLLVEQNGRLVGFVGEPALATEADATPIATAMTSLGACLRPAMSVAQAREVFARTEATALPVIAGGFVLGAVARADIESRPVSP